MRQRPTSPPRHPYVLLLLGLTACTGAGLGSQPRVAVETNGKVACDLNNDGFADVIIASSTNSTFTAWYGSNTGLGSVAGPTSPTNAFFGQPQARWIGDVDDDGYADVALYDARAAVDDVYLKWGGDTSLDLFVPGLGGALPRDEDFDTYNIEVFRTGDLNGDGIDDLGVRRGGYDITLNTTTTRIELFPGGSRTPTLASRVVIDPYRPGWYNGPPIGLPEAIGDIDGDGFDDLFVRTDPLTYESGLAGSVLFGAANLLRPSSQDVYAALAFPNDRLSPDFANDDYNGDGVADLLSADSSGQGMLYRSYSGAGDGTFTAGSVSVGPTDAYSNVPTSLAYGPFAAVGDINADGYADLVRATPGQIFSSIQELSSLGYFDTDDEDITWYAGWHAFYGQPDGIMDRALQNTPPPQSIEQHNNGSGVAWGLGVSGAGDVNGDGFADVLISDSMGWNLYLGSNQGLPEQASQFLEAQTPSNSIASSGGFLR